MAGDATVRVITDLFFKRGNGRAFSLSRGVSASSDGLGIPTKAFGKFLSCLVPQESPSILDLGPVVGANISFFGDRLGCKIFVEDLYADLERLLREGRIGELAGFFERRVTQPESSIDGILCWDLFDYLDRPAALTLALHLSRVLRPGGALLGFFATAREPEPCYTKYAIVDDAQFLRRTYPASRGRQPVWLNRDIIHMFEGLLISDSFLLKTNTREMLFRKPGNSGSPQTRRFGSPD